MASSRPFLTACLLLVTGVWLTTGKYPAAAQKPPESSAPMEVTTDTPEYCQYLQTRLHALVHSASSPPPQEVTDLLADGQRMCEHGQTRGGIMRLRRAMMLVTHDDGAADR